MFRKDREITDLNAIMEIMKRCHVCRLGFNDRQSGYPYIVPMNFGLIEKDGKTVLCFHCAKRGYKLDCMAQDNRVFFEMECDVELVYNPAHKHNTDIFKSVTGRGRAQIIENPEEKRVFLQALVDRYHDQPITVTSADADRCTIFTVTVEEFWGKEKKVPTAPEK